MVNFDSSFGLQDYLKKVNQSLDESLPPVAEPAPEPEYTATASASMPTATDYDVIGATAPVVPDVAIGGEAFAEPMPDFGANAEDLNGVYDPDTGEWVTPEELARRLKLRNEVAAGNLLQTPEGGYSTPGGVPVDPSPPPSERYLPFEDVDGQWNGPSREVTPELIREQEDKGLIWDDQTGEFRAPLNMREMAQAARHEFSQSAEIYKPDAGGGFDIPYVSDFMRDTVQPLAGDVAASAASFMAPPGLGAEDEMADVGRFVGESMIPVKGEEFLLEMVPGVGEVPDLLKAAKKIKPAALTSLLQKGLADLIPGSPTVRSMADDGMLATERIIEELPDTAPPPVRFTGEQNPVQPEDIIGRQDESARTADEGYRGSLREYGREVERPHKQPVDMTDDELSEALGTYINRLGYLENRADAALARGDDPDATIEMMLEGYEDEYEQLLYEDTRRAVQRYKEDPRKLETYYVHPADVDEQGFVREGADLYQNEQVARNALYYLGYKDPHAPMVKLSGPRMLFEPDPKNPEIYFKGKQQLWTGDTPNAPAIRGAQPTTALPPGQYTFTDLKKALQHAALFGPQADDHLRRLAEIMDHVPVLRNLVKTVASPAAVARRDPVLAEIVGSRMAEEVLTAQATQDLARLQSQRNPFQMRPVKGAGAAQADVEVLIPSVALPGQAPASKGATEWVALGDIFENPDHFVLTPAQRKVIDNSHEIIQKWAKIAEASTGEEIIKRGEKYFPRFNVNDNAHLIIDTGPHIGNKPSFLHERMQESMQDAIDDGFKYVPGYVTPTSLYLRGIISFMAHRSLRDGLEGLGKIDKLPSGQVMKMDRLSGTSLGRDLEGYSMLPDTFKKIADGWVAAPQKGVTATAEKINSVWTTVLAGSADMGGAFIQGQAALSHNPVTWFADNVRAMYAAFIDPKSVYKYLSNSPAAQRASQYGVRGLMASEYWRGMGALSKLSNVPVAGIPAKVAETILGRVQIGFDGFLAMARTEMFDAMARSAIKAGEPESELYRLARFVNTAVGSPGMRGLGMSAGQRQIERAYLAFAPSYTRSIPALLGHAMGKGRTAREAKLLASKWLLGGTAAMGGLAAASAELRGEDPEEAFKRAVIPGYGKLSELWSIPMGDGVHVGLGGGFRALLGLVGSAPDLDNWKKLTSDDTLFDNPLIAYLRSRTTPLTGTLMDFIDGEDFIGKRVGANYFMDNPDRAAEYALGKFSPIALKNFFTGGSTPLRARAGVFGAEFVGMRGGDVPIGRDFDTLYNDLVKEKFGLTAEDIQWDIERQWQVKNDPRYAALEAEAESGNKDRNQSAMSKFMDMDEDIRSEHALRMEEHNGKFQLGQISAKEWKIERDTSLAIQSDAIRRAIEQTGVNFDGGRGADAPYGTVTRAYRDYQAVNVKQYKVNGETDWEAFFAARDAALEQLADPADRQRVMDYINRRLSSIERAYKEDQDYLNRVGWWDVRSNVAQQMGMDLKTVEKNIRDELQIRGRASDPASVAKEVEKELNDWLRRSTGAKEKVTKHRDGTTSVELEGGITLEKLREQMRESDPHAELALYKWGNVTVARNPQTIILATEQVANGVPGVRVPPPAKDSPAEKVFGPQRDLPFGPGMDRLEPSIKDFEYDQTTRLFKVTDGYGKTHELSEEALREYMSRRVQHGVSMFDEEAPGGFAVNPTERVRYPDSFDLPPPETATRRPGQQEEFLVRTGENPMTNTDIRQSLVSPVGPAVRPSAQSREFARERWVQLGLPEDLAFLAPITNNANIAWTSENEQFVQPLNRPGQEGGTYVPRGGQSHINTGRALLDMRPEVRGEQAQVMMHEMTHAIEDLMSIEDWAKFDKLRRQNPLSRGLGRDDASRTDRWHTLTGYLDEYNDIHHKEGGVTIPPAILAFLKEIAPKVIERAKQRGSYVGDQPRTYHDPRERWQGQAE